MFKAYNNFRRIMKHKLEIYYRTSKDNYIIYNPNKNEVQLNNYKTQKAVDRVTLNSLLKHNLLTFVDYL